MLETLFYFAVALSLVFFGYAIYSKSSASLALGGFVWFILGFILLTGNSIDTGRIVSIYEEKTELVDGNTTTIDSNTFYTYEALTTANPLVFVLANLFFYGGIVGMASALVGYYYAFKGR